MMTVAALLCGAEVNSTPRRLLANKAAHITSPVQPLSLRNRYFTLSTAENNPGVQKRRKIARCSIKKIKGTALSH